MHTATVLSDKGLLTRSLIDEAQETFLHQLKKRITPVGQGHAIYSPGKIENKWKDILTVSELDKIIKIVTDFSNVYIFPVHCGNDRSIGYKINSVYFTLHPAEKTTVKELLFFSEAIIPISLEKREEFFQICRTEKNILTAKTADPNCEIHAYTYYE